MKKTCPRYGLKVIAVVQAIVEVMMQIDDLTPNQAKSLGSALERIYAHAMCNGGIETPVCRRWTLDQLDITEGIRRYLRIYGYEWEPIDDIEQACPE